MIIFNTGSKCFVPAKIKVMHRFNLNTLTIYLWARVFCVIWTNLTLANVMNFIFWLMIASWAFCSSKKLTTIRIKHFNIMFFDSPMNGWITWVQNAISSMWSQTDNNFYYKHNIKITWTLTLTLKKTLIFSIIYYICATKAFTLCW